MDMVENLADLFLSSKGRISRKTFWIGVGALVAWSILVFIVLWSALGASLVQTFLGRLVGFPFELATIYFGYNLAAKRFNDRARPLICAAAGAGVAAVKSLLDLVRITGDPLTQTWLDELFILAGTGIALWYFLELGLMRGTVGPNDHGEDPEPERA
ncbi:DUF805 domain-containing protein [Bradyrhizobium sp. LHD-71]|uniref:DUF805 domain-containing protein n=1 Tax=Bradyrhizobium sp. LHD-71 TaxID=3072141 RepID=UPI002810783D|nr:DUF805 domain-containing protein [Bradyrhizobium sp. LHD-71]MDQ8727256.1 DUF805 domain-containing protein [Bradyrhizobium sp. LHD-71]